MKIYKTLIVLIASLGGAFAASVPEKIRTVNDIPGFPINVLQRTISRTIYNTSSSRLSKDGFQFEGG